MDSRPVIVITGATNGLGRLAALDLARAGAHLGIVARSQKKVDKLRQDIEPRRPLKSVPGGETGGHRRCCSNLAARGPSP